MGVATGYDPLLTRVEELLVDGEGSRRSLEEKHRFARGFHPLMTEEEAARLILTVNRDRGVWPILESQTPVGTPDAVSDRRRVLVTVRLDLFYHGGSGLQQRNWRDTMAEVADDAHRIAAVLEGPHNLDQTEDGRETGLASGALTWTGDWALEDPDPESDLFRASVRFQGVVELQQPS